MSYLSVAPCCPVAAYAVLLFCPTGDAGRSRLSVSGFWVKNRCHFCRPKIKKISAEKSASPRTLSSPRSGRGSMAQLHDLLSSLSFLFTFGYWFIFVKDETKSTNALQIQTPRDVERCGFTIMICLWVRYIHLIEAGEYFNCHHWNFNKSRPFLYLQLGLHNILKKCCYRDNGTSNITIARMFYSCNRITLRP